MGAAICISLRSRCYRRLPLLRSVRARNVFVQILGEVRDRYGFSLVGYVVMPEHIHLLISEPAKGTPSTAIQVLKQRVSRRLRRKKRSARRTIEFDLCRRRQFAAALLAAAVLRLQRVESEEESRKTSLHAHESAEKKIGRAPERLALEQFPFTQTQERVDPD